MPTQAKDTAALTRMSVLAEDWTTVRMAALAQGVPAQHYAGELLAQLIQSADVVTKREVPFGAGLKRRAAWIAVPSHARDQLEDLRERTDASWSRLLHIALHQDEATAA